MMGASTIIGRTTKKKPIARKAAAAMKIAKPAMIDADPFSPNCRWY